MDTKLSLYRRRYEPDETVFLKDDQILYSDETMIITKWNCLKPRNDIACGISAYLLKDGIKISKVMDADGRLVYWYCDIIEAVYDSVSHSYTFYDLLIDVLIYENGSVKVVDLNELGDVLESEKITKKQAVFALRTADHLLHAVYDGRFSKYQELIQRYQH